MIYYKSKENIMKNYQVGDILYNIRKKNNMLKRKKIELVIGDDTWYRYDIPRNEYMLVVYIILGVLEKNLIGEWPDSDAYELDTEYFVSKNESGVYEKCVTDFQNDKFFTDYAEALTYLHSLQDQADDI
jgi:hypothetical protein